MRKIAICIGIAGAAVALAATVIVGARGTGGAVDSVGTKYGFAMDAKKITADGSVRVAGYFRVRREYREGTNNFLVEIGMEPDELGKIENKVNMAGPARRVIKRNGVVIRTDHGRMAASVVDRRRPTTNTGEPDLITFKYVLPNAVPAVQFNGRVYWGDIEVYQRTE